MGGCCRRRGSRTISGDRQPSDCKTLESGGAGTRLWPVSTDKGIRLTVKTISSGFVELSSFLALFGCSGATASLIRRNLPLIQSMLNTNPSLVARYTKSGISVTELIGLAVRASKGSTDAGAVQT